ncbi:hypothetical protein DB42_CC00030 [Neochlamydia sp. EPS4]|uniref:hypothetical protein n=1 Tax=Neochlamydia sp. EPS4 TaxID=1478175 RepID=UPI00058284BE|nr:hypothetical protein [Neochlamydia sp. EPS4]KIC73292.1 hypothetical protein DB42_CC00030 [Neochlamydia sp. EPS4]
MTPISTSSSEYKQFKESFTQYAQYTAAVNNLKIFVEEQATQNLRQFVEENKESYKVHLQEEARQIAEKKAELAAKRVDIAASKEQLAAKRADIAARKEELAARKEELAARKEQLNTREEELDATLEQLANTRIEAETKIAQAQATLKFGYVKLFYSVFGLPVPSQSETDKIDQIAATYFPNGEIGNINGQATLFSISPIEKYLRESRSTISKLNLTAIRIIHDPKNLVEFLQKPGCPIKFIGVDARLKDSLEQQVDEICPKEGRTFKIVYVQPPKK